MQAACHMREAAECLEAAQAARAAGLQREQLLAGRVRCLRQQLEQRSMGSHGVHARQGAEAASTQADSDCAAQMVPARQLQAVGQEPSSNLEATQQETGALHTALSAGQVRASAAMASKVESLQRELQAALEAAAGKDAELRALRAEAEVGARAAAERKQAAEAAAAAMAEQQHEAVRLREAEAASFRREAALVAEEAARERQRQAAELQAQRQEANEARVAAERMAQDVRSSSGTAQRLQRELEEAQHKAQQVGLQVT